MRQTTLSTNRNPDRLIAQFLKTTGQHIHAYNDDAAANKELFHRYGKSLLKRIARDLGYTVGSYDVSSDKAGIAVSGEITLHTDDLYVQFSSSPYSEDYQILYRRCKHRRDYRGERNHFMRFQALRQYNQVITAMQSLRIADNP